jgi:hypothetical protein
MVRLLSSTLPKTRYHVIFSSSEAQVGDEGNDISALLKEHCRQHLQGLEQRKLSDAYNGIIADLSVLDRKVTDLRDTAWNSM